MPAVNAVLPAHPIRPDDDSATRTSRRLYTLRCELISCTRAVGATGRTGATAVCAPARAALTEEAGSVRLSDEKHLLCLSAAPERRATSPHSPARSGVS